MPNTMTTNPTSKVGRQSPRHQQLPEELVSNIPLVHRVLMADPSEIVYLTLSGDARVLDTPSFQDFEQLLNQRDLDTQEGLDISNTMKRAFRDQLCTRMKDEQSIEPAQNLLIELHGQLRGLIPSRKDLHGLLHDDAVNDAQSHQELLRLCAQAGHALTMLESDARAESTLAWIDLTQTGNTLPPDEDSGAFLVTSLLYLLLKAELCAKDKQDFYFSHIWAPQISRIGPNAARTAFEKQFGSFSDNATAPVTRQWIRAMDVSSQTSAVNLDTQIKKSWVHDILLRDSTAGTMSLPEIFYLDQSLLKSIRMVVRMAVTGSALSLYACQTAGQSNEVLGQHLEPSSELDLWRARMVQAMSERFKEETRFRENIADRVVELARHWKPNLDSSNAELLRNRTCRVLAADDSVLELLDARMKSCFTALLTSTSIVPAELRSGRSSGLSTDTSPSSSRKVTFLTNATSLFCNKGLAFFASDLALAAWNALRIIEVALLLYYDVLLEPSLHELDRRALA